MTEASSRTLDVPGGNIYYEICGKGPLLVLIGPGNTDATAFADMMPDLSEHFSVVTYDRRGYSRSRGKNPIAEVSIEGHANDLHLVIQDITNEPVLVFGSSAGAVVAIELLARFPLQVRAIIAHEPPIPSILPAETLKAQLEEKQQFEEVFRNQGAAAAMKLLANKIGGGHSEPGESKIAILNETQSSEKKANHLFFLLHESKAIDSYSPALESLKRERRKITLGAGAESEGFMPNLCAKALAALLQTNAVEFPGSHAGFVRDHSAFSSKLVEILKGIK